MSYKGQRYTNSKVVIKYDESGTILATFSTITEASIITGVAHQNIWKVCTTGYKSKLGGYYYRYAT